MELNDALYMLLHHRRYLTDFLNQDWPKLNLTPESIEALQTIDTDELVRTSNRIVRNLYSGGSTSEGGLRQRYPRTLSAFTAIGFDPIEIVMSFMESRWFEEYKELPFYSLGICIEEAFYCYLAERDEVRHNSHFELVLTHEFLVALMSVLVTNWDRAFEIRSEAVKSNGCCYYVAIEYSQRALEVLGIQKRSSIECAPTVYLIAATRRRLICGQISALTLSLINLGSRDRILECCNFQPMLDGNQLRQALCEMVSLELVA